MWATLKCFVRRFTGDAHLEALLRRNREALERKRREARLSLPNWHQSPMTSKLVDRGILTSLHAAAQGDRAG